jgi:hypothetical protein
VPKLARGRIPEELDGASAIHSADDRWALLIVLVMLNGLPDPTVIVAVNCPLPSYLTSAEITSPGLTLKLPM